MTKDVSENVASQERNLFARILRGYWPGLLIAGLFFAVQYPVLAEWWEVWTVHDSYFSHGPLIPFIFGYMVWSNRHRLATLPIRPSWGGMALLLPVAVLFVAARWLQSASFSTIAFIGMVFAIMLLLFGGRITRVLAIPIFFTLTMIPISTTLLDNATNKLQLQSAAVACRFLQWSGFDATLNGTAIQSSSLPQDLVVGIPCSGLRTLISLLTFTFFFIYVVRAAWWKKTILVALSFPLALFVNSLRITLIGYVGAWMGTAESMKAFHDYSGYIGLVICFLILFGIAKLMGAGELGLPPAKREPEQHSAKPMAPMSRSVPAFATMAVLVLLCFANLYASPIYPSTKGHIPDGTLPERFGEWTSRIVPVSEQVRGILSMGDLQNRQYMDMDGHVVDVFVDAARDPNAFHDPHSCLPSGGSPIVKDRTIKLRLTKPRPREIQATLLVSRSAFGQSIVIYWYAAGDDSLPLTSDVWHYNRQYTRRDLAYLLLHPGSRNQLKEQIERRQFIWYRFSTDVYNDMETDRKTLERFISEFVAHSRGFGK